MFLDDELYQKVKEFKIAKPEDFETLVNDLYKICENYYKSKLPPLVGCSYKDVTQLMDRTFKLWDLFILQLEKEDWYLLDVLKDYPYKKAFLSNEKLKELYERGN
jgi:adenosyl cobinamide kinase/adenosyl cobinamide phosphate guanylyltransferase